MYSISSSSWSAIKNSSISAFNSYSGSHWYAQSSRKFWIWAKLGPGGLYTHPSYHNMKWAPVGTSFSPPGGVEILSMGKLKWPFEPWMSMNQKLGYVAWRGPKSFTKSSKKIFGSGPFLILQDHSNFFRTYFEPQKKGRAHIRISSLALTIVTIDQLLRLEKPIRRA